MRTGKRSVWGGSRLRRLAAKLTWTAADAQEALAARNASGLTHIEFAQRSGIGVNRLWWWGRRLNSPASTTASPAMLRVHVREEASVLAAMNGVVEIELAGGRIVRVKHGFDPAELRRVVTALE